MRENGLCRAPAMRAFHHASMVTDEQRHVDYDKAPKYVVLESKKLDGLTYKGRVVSHAIHAMWTSQYLELHKRPIGWLTRQL
jgi:hypothetical protein